MGANGSACAWCSRVSSTAPCRQAEGVLGRVGVQSDSWSCSWNLLLMRSRQWISSQMRGSTCRNVLAAAFQEKADKAVFINALAGFASPESVITFVDLF